MTLSPRAPGFPLSTRCPLKPSPTFLEHFPRARAAAELRPCTLPQKPWSGLSGQDRSRQLLGVAGRAPPRPASAPCSQLRSSSPDCPRACTLQPRGPAPAGPSAQCPPMWPLASAPDGHTVELLSDALSYPGRYLSPTETSPASVLSQELHTLPVKTRK